MRPGSKRTIKEAIKKSEEAKLPQAHASPCQSVCHHQHLDELLGPPSGVRTAYCSPTQPCPHHSVSLHSAHFPNAFRIRRLSGKQRCSAYEGKAQVLTCLYESQVKKRQMSFRTFCTLRSSRNPQRKKRS